MGALFFCDTHVNVDPSAEQIAEMTQLAAKTVRRFGLAPKPRCCPIPASAPRIRPAPSRCARRWRCCIAAKLDFEIDGEMHADAA